LSDPFGRALLDAMDGHDGQVSVERDDGWRDEYAVGLYLSGAHAWAPATVAALEALDGRVLDVGAGAGRHASFLAERGVDVLALDSSPGAVEACRRQGLDAVLGAVGEDGVLDGNRFDAVLLLGHNLGLLESPRHAPAALTWLGEHTAPGGVLIGDGLDTTIADEASWSDYNARNRRHGRRAGQSRMRIAYADDLGDWFEYWLVSPPDLEESVRDTGWRVERVELDEDERFRGEYVATLRRV
jgi:SAM-dependent methyltransferase